MTRRFEALTKGGFPYLVAVMKDVVVGYAYAGPYRPRPAYRFTVENSVYLDPGAQGQRIGTRLMQDLIAACEARGIAR
jgi:phosphinothricin acetyltransferase